MTLIELVVVIAILSSIILAITSFYISGVRGFVRESTTVSNQVKVRRASNEIGREVRRTSNITSTSNTLELVYSNGKKTIYQKVDSSIKADHYQEDPLNPSYYLYSSTTNLVDGIKDFIVTISGDNIEITIESTANSEDATYTLVNKLTIR